MPERAPHGRGPDLLVVATCARALACSARSAGYRPLVLDGFADADTAAAAQRMHRVALGPAGPSAPQVLEAAARHSDLPLLYGAGFEGQPRLLAQLAVGRELLGNRPEVAALAADPFAFGELAGQAGLAFPETRAEAPTASRGWLLKRAGASGGAHVRPAGGEPDEGDYWQRRMPGRSCSLLFLADGRHYRSVGVSEQWGSGEREHPYRYAGAVSRALLPPRVEAELRRGVAVLVRRLGLRGLNTLDLLVDGDSLWVLELNARPGATFELYDGRGNANLVQAHIAACRGELAPLRRGNSVRGHAVVYAPQALRIPTQWHWPGWVRDRQPAGSRVAAQAPLCTIHAAGRHTAPVRRQLGERRARLMRELLAQQDAAEPGATKPQTAAGPYAPLARAGNE